jgi:hypothetical protein
VVKDTIYCDESLIDTIPFEDLPLYINYKFEGSIYEHLTKRLQSIGVSNHEHTTMSILP